MPDPGFQCPDGFPSRSGYSLGSLPWSGPLPTSLCSVPTWPHCGLLNTPNRSLSKGLGTCCPSPEDPLLQTHAWTVLSFCSGVCSNVSSWVMSAMLTLPKGGPILRSHLPAVLSFCTLTSPALHLLPTCSLPYLVFVSLPICVCSAAAETLFCLLLHHCIPEQERQLSG